MKLSVTFALLSLAAVVMSDKGIVPGGHPWYPDRWQDVSGVCPAGEGYAVQRAEKGGGKFCTPCKLEDQTKTASCNSSQKRTMCKKWQEQGYCMDSNKYAWYVQKECPVTCNVCRIARGQPMNMNSGRPMVYRIQN